MRDKLTPVEVLDGCIVVTIIVLLLALIVRGVVDAM